jgi:uncharacterized membrane protein YidH (DUF202 family)
MHAPWLRVLVGSAAAAGALVIGLLATGTFDATPDENGIAAGARTVAALGLIAVAIGVITYGIVEWLQTRRLESIRRQFGTRTIVLMPLAIAMNIVLGQTVAYALRLPIYFDSVGTILVGVLAGPIAGAATGALSNLAWTFLLAGTPFGSPYAWPFAVVAAEIGFVAGLVGSSGLLRARPETPVAKLVAAVGAALVVLGGIAVLVVLPFYRQLCATPDGAGSALCAPSFSPTGDAVPMGVVLGIFALALAGLAVVGFLLRLAMDRDLGAIAALVTGVTCGVISALIAAPIATIVFGGVSGAGTDILVFAFLQAGSDLQTAVVQQSLLSDSIDKALTYVLVFVLLGATSRRIVTRFPQGDRLVRVID